MEGAMEFRDEAEMERLACGMMACTLPKEEWTHAAHFASALWLMARRPEMDLPAEMPGLIRGYNESVGGQNTETAGYHETITQASLRAARACFVERAGEPVQEVMNALMRSPLGRSDWLLTYWTRERLFSVEARREWVEPDLRGLPW
jgi:hypothetical protein